MIRETIRLPKTVTSCVEYILQPYLALTRTKLQSSHSMLNSSLKGARRRQYVRALILPKIGIKVINPTFTPIRLLGVSSKETAVRAEVTLAVNIAMIMSPNMIQMMEKVRATMDFGDLSP